MIQLGVEKLVSEKGRRRNRTIAELQVALSILILMSKHPGVTVDPIS